MACAQAQYIMCELLFRILGIKIFNLKKMKNDFLNFETCHTYKVLTFEIFFNQFYKLMRNFSFFFIEE